MMVEEFGVNLSIRVLNIHSKSISLRPTYIKVLRASPEPKRHYSSTSKNLYIMVVIIEYYLEKTYICVQITCTGSIDKCTTKEEMPIVVQ